MENTKSTHRLSTGDEIDTRLVVPDNPQAMIILSHGAGAGIDHQFMEDIQEIMANSKLASFAFNFLFRQQGGRPPYRMTKPIGTFVEIWDHITGTYELPTFAAGKSYGGRIASHAIDRLEGCRGLIFLGYPFHPPNKLDKLRTAHLYGISHPMLFLQGTRDRLSDPNIVNSFVENSSNSTLQWLEDGDHSWKPRKRSGLTQEDLMIQAVKAMSLFISAHSLD